MKNALLILILILFWSCKSHLQTGKLEYTIFNEKQISEFKSELKAFSKINELRNKKIDFIAYKEYSIGSVRLLRVDDPNNCAKCISNYSIYIFWEENKNQYLQILDNCGEFFPIKIEDRNILESANQNFEILNLERIKFYQTDENSISMISHSTFKEFLISKQGNEIYNYFDVYNLKTDSEYPNLNYDYNQKLKIIQLNHLIEEEIKEAESKSLFKRDLSKCN